MSKDPVFRITAISFGSQAMPRFGRMEDIRNVADPGRYAGWTIALRGGAVFLISPAGWAPGEQGLGAERGRDPRGPRTVLEVPGGRAACAIMWEADDPAVVDKLQRHDQLLVKPKAEAELAPEAA